MPVRDKLDQVILEAAVRIHLQTEEIKRLREILAMTDPEGMIEYLQEKADELKGRN